MSNTSIIAIIICSIIVIFSTGGYIWSKFVENELNKMDVDIDKLCKSTSKTCEAFNSVGCTTEEAAEAFKVFRAVIDTPVLTVNELREKRGYDKIKEQLESSRYGIVYTDDNATIERVSPPKEYCQCDYCGTFYTEFVSNCKNCGALIRKPDDFGKIGLMITYPKMNYLKR